MSNDLGNKEIMAENIKHYMLLNNVNSAEMCKVLRVPRSTFSYWINARCYPRIDKIEQMANYFNISKADLVEKRNKLALKEDELDSELLGRLLSLTPEQREKVDAYIQGLLASR